MTVASVGFEDRIADVNALLTLLRYLQRPDSEISFVDQAERISVSVDAASVSVAKAAVFVVLYNLVEATVRTAFSVLYEQIKSEGVTVQVLSSELRKLWIDQHFRFGGVDLYSASPRNFHESAERLVGHAIEDAIASLRGDRLPISGNLDADEIRSVCRKHGVSDRTDRVAAGGGDLSPVKQNRNALAHGNITFSECGRQYAVDDLERIAKQTETYLRGVLRNVEGFLSARTYHAGSATRGRPAKGSPAARRQRTKKR